MLLYPADKRGVSNLEWLKSRHTFSFSQYYDPERMGFATLRVINEDIVAPDKGFSTHQHSNMEIISYVLDGALAHKDSLGNFSTIRKHEWQVMTAGTGVTHSEHNDSKTNKVHFLQIWLTPQKLNISPSYAQKIFTPETKLSKLKLVVSPTGRQGSLPINQNADIYVGILKTPSDSFTHQLMSSHQAWVQVTKGSLKLNSLVLNQGDGVAIKQPTTLHFKDAQEAEIILFDMAAP